MPDRGRITNSIPTMERMNGSSGYCFPISQHKVDAHEPGPLYLFMRFFDGFHDIGRDFESR
jgi:hypothetical protein